ncbi:MAG: UDP-N-acetylmuramate--L-alanine ligase, partial [Minisyncoccia bacterium]
MDMRKINEIHFIGVGGIGLSAIARLMKKKGKIVSGSDFASSLITEKLRKIGVNVFIGQSENNISEDVDLVIYTMAVPKNNPELVEAKKLGIRTLTYPEFLGMVFNEKLGIAVCGTHGKSSTTAMAGLLLDDSGIDPTILVGSIVPKYDSNLRVGESEYMIIEACEYERAFLHYYPKIIVMNNIELDHTDYYRDIDDFRSAFEEFVGHLPKGGMLIVNGDDGEISKLKVQMSNQFQSSNIKIISFGLYGNNNVGGYDVKTEAGKTKFNVKYKGKELGEFALKVPGIFNVYNSLGVIALGLTLDIPIDIIKKSLAGYSGIWRRFEIKGEYKPSFAFEKLWRGKSALVISDYAHHPTAVKVTIEAAKSFYPGRRIFAVFQPHQHNRTKKLYNNFLKSFGSADLVILSEIFDVAGREEKEDQNVSSLNLANDIKKIIGEKSGTVIARSEATKQSHSSGDEQVIAALPVYPERSRR